MDEIGASMVDLIQLGFNDSKDPYGNQWDDVGRGGDPLRNTAVLMNSFNATVRGDSVVVGSNITVGDGYNLGAIHQEGVKIKPRKAKYLKFMIGDRFVSAKEVTIPARPMIPNDQDWPAEWSDEVNEILLRHITA